MDNHAHWLSRRKYLDIFPSPARDRGHISCGLIGYGYWGPNLARNISRDINTHISYISDIDSARVMVARAELGPIKTCSDPYDLIRDPDVDAVVITTPVETHFDLAYAAVSEGKHVLISKPMTRTTAQAETLVELAARKNVVLMVDHTFLFSNPVRKIAEILKSNLIGNVNYFHSNRINLGLFRSDVSVLWDLAPHDISILLYLLKEKPEAVSAIGAQPASHINYHLSSLAYINLMFRSGLVAHLHVSWLSPVKVRQTIIGGSAKMVVYNDLEPNNPIKLFDKGVEPRNAVEAYELLVQYRSGDMYAPKVEQREPLSALIEEFVSAVEHKYQPVSDGVFGSQVVALLEAADASIARHGASVSVAI